MIDIKFKRLYWPFLQLSIAVVLVSVLLRWLLDDVFHLAWQVESFEYWLPVSVALMGQMWLSSWPMALGYVGRWQKRLYLWLTFVVLAFPAVVVQLCWSDLGATLHQMDRVEEVATLTHGDFLTISTVDVLTSELITSSYWTAETGKLDVKEDVAAPMVSRAAVDAGDTRTWAVKTYYYQADDPGNKGARLALLDSLADRAASSFRRLCTPASAIKYWQRLPLSARRQRFLAQLKQAAVEEDSAPRLLLEPFTASFATRPRFDLFSVVFMFLVVQLLTWCWCCYDRQAKRYLQHLQRSSRTRRN